MARSSARFGSRSLFSLTRARFSARDTGTRLARFCSRLVSGCSKSGSARGSAYHSSGTDSVRLSSIHYLGLGSSRLIAQAGLETRLGNREIGSMLDLAQLGARLRPSSGPSIGLSWRFARGSGLGIRLDLSWRSAPLTCLGLGPGRGLVRFGSAARLETQGSTQDSALGLDRSPARLISIRKIV